MAKARVRKFGSNGFFILVGHSDEDNDQLTFDIAKPDDIWFHVAGSPGSHAVLQMPSQLIPSLVNPLIPAAAQLAAWYSKARSQKVCNVHYTWVRNIVKPEGFPAGKVILLQKPYTVMVKPEKIL